MSSKSIPNFDRFTQSLFVGEWPPSRPILLRKGENYIIGISPSGQIEVLCPPDTDNKSKVWRSPPITIFVPADLNKSGREQLGFFLDFAINIGDVKNIADIAIWINEVQMRFRPQPHIVLIKSIQLKPEKLYETTSIGKIPHEREEWLFIETLKDLEERVFSSSYYSSVKASGLIRLLLAEDKPAYVPPAKSLGVRLAEKYGIPLEFEILDQDRKLDVRTFNPITNLPYEDASSSFAVWNNVYPMPPIIFVNREELLTTVVLWTGNDTTTVYTLIKTLADCGGGVHVGLPESMKPEKNRLLDFEQDGVLKVPISWNMMPQIGQVVLKGFIPLAQLILKKWA